MYYQEKVSTRSDVMVLYKKVVENPSIERYRGYTELYSYGWDAESGDCIKHEGEHWFDNPCYDPPQHNPKTEDDRLEKDTVLDDGKRTPKHPHFNWQRGMLCPTCDKALWTRVEVKSLFSKKNVIIKDQPNFCKYCGQALLAAYTEN